MIIDSHVHLWAKKYYGDAFKPTSSEGRDISYASGFPDVDFDVLIQDYKKSTCPSKTKYLHTDTRNKRSRISR